MKNANNGAGEAMLKLDWDRYSAEIVAAQAALDDKKEKADASHIERIKAIAAKFPRNLDVREIHANKEFHKSLHAAFLNADKDGVARYTIGTAGNYTSTYKTVMLALSHGVTLPASVNNLAKAYEYCRRELGELGVMSKKAPKPEKAVTADGEIVGGETKPEKRQPRMSAANESGDVHGEALLYLATTVSPTMDQMEIAKRVRNLAIVFAHDAFPWNDIDELAEAYAKESIQQTRDYVKKQLTHA